ncbi:MAG: DUF2520 domain-containing protein [Acidobacteria bacterium]|nr:MAG: DUF2520 domain-containing protein [Acidobacteriota bacterium]
MCSSAHHPRGDRDDGTMGDSEGMMRTEIRLSIIGPGRVGQTLGWALARRGFPIIDVLGRDERRTENAVAFIGSGRGCTRWDELSEEWDLLLVSVNDDALTEVAERIAHRFPSLRGKTALHTSGFHSSRILHPLKDRGAAVGSLHPLMTFSEPSVARERLSGISYAVEGDASAVAQAHRLVAALEGRAFSIGPEQKPLYHAAAVLACGHVVALLETAFAVLDAIGLEPASARRAFDPLIRETIENVLREGGRRALTGPFARGDARVIAAHLAALADVDREGEFVDVYACLGRRALHLASLTPTHQAAIRAMLTSDSTDLLRKETTDDR